jgi:hypothetical protein
LPSRPGMSLKIFSVLNRFGLNLAEKMLKKRKRLYWKSLRC